jgi:hypothetical protein
MITIGRVEENKMIKRKERKKTKGKDKKTVIMGHEPQT